MVEQLGKLNVTSSDLFEEFKGKVIKIEIDSPPSFPEIKQYHLFVQPSEIDVKGASGFFHIFIRIPKKTLEKGEVVEGSVLYRYIQEIQSLVKESKGATKIEEVFETMVNKTFLFKKQILGQSYKGNPARQYFTPKELIKNGK